MTIDDDHVAALCAYLSGEFDAHERAVRTLLRDGRVTGYLSLLEAAAFEAIDRVFGAAETDDEVILGVAHLRIRSHESADGIDPEVAERLIRAVLGRESIDDLDDKARFGTETALLGGLFADPNIERLDVEAFVDQARAIVDERR